MAQTQDPNRRTMTLGDLRKEDLQSIRAIYAFVIPQHDGSEYHFALYTNPGRVSAFCDDSVKHGSAVEENVERVVVDAFFAQQEASKTGWYPLTRSLSIEEITQGFECVFEAFDSERRPVAQQSLLVDFY